MLTEYVSLSDYIAAKCVNAKLHICQMVSQVSELCLSKNLLIISSDRYFCST